MSNTNRWPAGDKRGGQFAPKKRGPAMPTEAKTAPAKGSMNEVREGASLAAESLRAPRAGTWAGVRKRLRTASWDQLHDAWRAVTLMPAGAGRTRALAELDAELERRTGQTEVADEPRSRAIDAALEAGAPHHEAHHVDEAEQRMDEVTQNMKLWGKSRRVTMRRMYDEHVYTQWLAAEEATRGHLVTPAGRAKGIDPTKLWAANPATARKWASDELKQWWEDHGGRDNYAVWSSRYTGNRRAAQAARGAGGGKDFGV